MISKEECSEVIAILIKKNSEFIDLLKPHSTDAALEHIPLDIILYVLDYFKRRIDTCSVSYLAEFFEIYAISMVSAIKMIEEKKFVSKIFDLLTRISHDVTIQEWKEIERDHLVALNYQMTLSPPATIIAMIQQYGSEDDIHQFRKELNHTAYHDVAPFRHALAQSDFRQLLSDSLMMDDQTRHLPTIQNKILAIIGGLHEVEDLEALLSLLKGKEFEYLRLNDNCYRPIMWNQAVIFQEDSWSQLIEEIQKRACELAEEEYNVNSKQMFNPLYKKRVDIYQSIFQEKSANLFSQIRYIKRFQALCKRLQDDHPKRFAKNG